MKKGFSKYKSEKVEFNGITFDSKMELKFYQNLLESGVEFELQPTFVLQEKFVKNGKTYLPITYKGDFKVGNIVYDTKGMETLHFKLKKKMFQYKFKDLELICIAPCPKKYLEHSIYGFIDKDLHKKLIKLSKK